MTASTESRVIKQGRPGVIVLIALVVELVAILSLANQVVARNLTTYGRHHPLSFPGHAALAATTYRWQVNAQPGDRANELLAHLCLDLVVLALTGLLVYVLTRGPVTFLRAFFGTWLTVIVATMLGMIVFALVSPPPYPGNLTHATGAVFLVPDGYGFVAGVVLGFVTALFAAIFAVATRRIIRIGPAYTEPAGGYRDDQPDWADQTMAYPRGEYGGAPEPERTGYGFGDSSGYGGSGYGSSAVGYAGSAAAGYYASQVGESGGERRAEPQPAAQSAAQPAAEPAAQPESDATQSIPRVEESTQAMAPPTGAQPVAETPGENEPGAQEPAEQPAPEQPAPEQPAPEQPAPEQPAPEQPAPEQPPAEEQPPADPAATQQFPRPPDDEDLGQQPGHGDL
jgi:hypothetical protein